MDALAGSGRVSSRTGERVEAAATAHGYVSNRVAKNLRQRSTGALGLHIPPVFRAATFYLEFAFGGAERASADGYDLTLFAQQGACEGGFMVDGAVDVDPLPELPDPAITCVRLGARQFADEAFGLLVDILAGTAERDAHRTHQAVLVTDELG